MTWRQINTSLIPWSDYVKESFKKKGNTADIIAAILKADSEYDSRFENFSNQFTADKKGLKLLWKFTRHSIKYQEDGFNIQDVKLAAALWKIGEGDCKSKTLFINQVLRCLKIPYITRFVGYDAKKITHVYSIAFLDGKPIILDSVHTYFNSEPSHNIEQDFNMADISIIRGLPKNNNIGTAEIDDLYHQAQGESLQRYEEIQQRKQYVQPEAPINFSNISEGEALLELLVRKLKIIGIMKDEQKTTTEKGIALIRNTIKTGKVSGIISNDLQGTAERINYYLSLNQAATGHGYRGKALNMMKLKAKSSSKYIGRQGLYCMASMWWTQQGGGGTTANPYVYSQFAGDSAQNCTSNTSSFLYQGRNNNYFFYGRNTDKFRTKYSDSWVDFQNIINDTVAQFPNSINQVNNNFVYNFANDSVFDALVEELKQGMPVLSNWANDLYKADNTRPDGTVGTGLLYNFVPDINQIAGITTGNFPSVVQTKMILQQQYMDSCVNFSTISRAIFEDMAENGILFDSGGETVERILSALILKYNPNIGLLASTAALIVGIISAVLTATPAIIAACNNGANDASKIDNSAKDTAAFKIQSGSTMPNMSDFEPLTQTGGGGSNGGSGGGNNNGNNNDKGSSLLPIGAAALTGRYLYKKYKNNKK